MHREAITGTLWNVTAIRFESVGPPFSSHPRSAALAAVLITRGEIMGFVDPDQLGTVLDGDAVRQALSGLASRGVAVVAVFDMADAALDAGIATALASSEHSPMPDGEWPALLATLGEEQLARLLDVSVSSVRRYSAGTRRAPDAVIARLHVLALIVADLAGAYNDAGIRRWFTRPRPQLDGSAPGEILAGNWDPDGPDAHRCRDLAAALTLAGAV